MEPQRSQRNTLCPQKEFSSREMDQGQRWLRHRLIGRGQSYYCTEHSKETNRIEPQYTLIDGFAIAMQVGENKG